MRVDLETFLRKDVELRADSLVAHFFEQGFGMPGDSWDELVLDLGGGRTARLRARIDRIDLGPDPAAPEQARLLHHNTGEAYQRRAFLDAPLVARTKAHPRGYAPAIPS